MARRLASKGYEETCVQHTLKRLVDDGYLSEERFAEGFLRTRMVRGETPRLAAMRARQRGVDAGAVERALHEAEDGFDRLSTCRELLGRRDPQGLRHSDARLWQRHARYLKNKGFDASTIMRVMREEGESEE
ncbi:MAG TPA: regulatory protein RecX [Mariprofundaceae bacterium]|nr:regulatory protein RecX [Mariprofundaceae bacterium]